MKPFEYSKPQTLYPNKKDYITFYVYDERDLGETVEQAEEYATIHFSRTLLEQIGVEFEHPMLKEND